MVTYPRMEETSHNKEEGSNKRRMMETPPNLAETIRILIVELQSFKVDNERLIKEQ